jgi:hypothetical protein
VLSGVIEGVRTFEGYHDLILFMKSYENWWAAEKIQIFIAPFREVKNIRFLVGVMHSSDGKIGISEGFCDDCCY